MLRKIENKVYDFFESVCSLFMLLMVLIVCYSVFGRFVLNKAPAWGDEIAIACMIWFGLISSSLAERDRKHIRISILDTVYPKKLSSFFRILNYFLKLFFGITICYNSVKLVIFNRNAYMASVNISQSWISLSGVFMGALMVFFLICNAKKELLNK